MLYSEIDSISNNSGPEIFCYFSMKTGCRYSLEAPQVGTSNEYQQHVFMVNMVK